MGLPQSSGMSQFQPAQSGTATRGVQPMPTQSRAQNPMMGLMQMLSMVQQMRQAGGQSPFGSKMSGQTQMARPTMPVRPMPMPSMPTPTPFQPVAQPAPRVLTPPPTTVPATPAAPTTGMGSASEHAGLSAADPNYAATAKAIGPTAAYQALFGYG